MSPTALELTSGPFTALPEIDSPHLPKIAFPRLNGHRSEWLQAITRGLRHHGIVITARCRDRVCGALPLALVQGPLFGRFLVSLPYVNSGGVWAHDIDTARSLIDYACELADEWNVRYLELRHEIPIDHPKLTFRRVDKVHMRLSLPESDAQFEKSLKSKLRSQVRKAESYPHSIHWGRTELLHDFYRVFSTNMRDLGTPVFSRTLFESILQSFGDNAELCVLKQNNQAVAGALLVRVDGITEVPSASSLRQANPTGANMCMYRHLLRRAMERGSQTFDFGRSSVESGTYKFKEQWGAVPHPAVWQYYVRKGSIESMRPDAQGNQRLIKVWKRLPVWVTRWIGPSIVRGIP